MQNTRDYEQERDKAKTSSPHSNSNIFGLNSMNFDIINSRNKILKRSSTYTPNKNSDQAQSRTQKTPMRIFDSTLFSGLQGLELDNMAMMIRTFNR